MAGAYAFHHSSGSLGPWFTQEKAEMCNRIFQDIWNLWTLTCPGAFAPVTGVVLHGLVSSLPPPSEAGGWSNNIQCDTSIWWLIRSPAPPPHHRGEKFCYFWFVNFVLCELFRGRQFIIHNAKQRRVKGFSAVLCEGPAKWEMPSYIQGTHRRYCLSRVL